MVDELSQLPVAAYRLYGLYGLVFILTSDDLVSLKNALKQLKNDLAEMKLWIAINDESIELTSPKFCYGIGNDRHSAEIALSRARDNQEWR